MAEDDKDKFLDLLSPEQRARQLDVDRRHAEALAHMGQLTQKLKDLAEQIEQSDIMLHVYTPGDPEDDPTELRKRADQATAERDTLVAKHLAGIDIAVITILPEEYGAVLACIDNPRHVRDGEPNLYSWKTGTFRAGAGEYSVVVALAGDPTNPIGALVTRETAQRFNPRYVVVLGVAGGFALEEHGQTLELGDVVVSKIIRGYEYGKIMSEGYQPRGDLTQRADVGLASAASGLIASGTDWWSSIQSQPPVHKTRTLARVGQVASGDKVVDDPSDAFFAAVLRAWPKVLAVEMEGAGAASAVEQLQSLGRTIGLVMIRGISDMPGTLSGAGTATRDAWKRYAAEAAARFLFCLVEHQWPVPPRGKHETPANVGDPTTLPR